MYKGQNNKVKVRLKENCPYLKHLQGVEFEAVTNGKDSDMFLINPHGEDFFISNRWVENV